MQLHACKTGDNYSAIGLVKRGFNFRRTELGMVQLDESAGIQEIVQRSKALFAPLNDSFRPGACVARSHAPHFFVCGNVAYNRKFRSDAFDEGLVNERGQRIARCVRYHDANDLMLSQWERLKGPQQAVFVDRLDSLGHCYFILPVFMTFTRFVFS